MNIKEENSGNFCLDFVQEFGLRKDVGITGGKGLQYVLVKRVMYVKGIGNSLQ